MPAHVEKPFTDYTDFCVICGWLLHHNHPLFHHRVELCFESGQTMLAANPRSGIISPAISSQSPRAVRGVYSGPKLPVKPL